jgi:hypothetical protein
VKKFTIFILILLALSAQKISSQNAPVTTAGIIAVTGSTVVVPITVSDFTNVSSCNLRLTYDPLIGTATLVTKGPTLPGSMNFGITNPGIVTIGWYHLANVTLPANTVLFNISFSKVTDGSSPLAFFDNGNSCKFSNLSSVVYNDVPASTYYINGSFTFQNYAPLTMASNASACPGSMVEVPVIVNNFNTIGAVSLSLNYNTTVLTYQSASVNALTWLDVDGTSVPGTVVIGGILDPAVSLPFGATLVTLNFLYNGGSTALSWYDNGPSCEYAGPGGTPILTDSPLGTYYSNGSVSPGPTQWTGTVSSAWENSTNWSCDIPAATSEITINASSHNPEISSAVTVKSLTINGGAKVTVNPNATLTVTNTLTNNAGNDGLLIRSDVTGTGSLLHNSTSVPATIQRYITGSTDLTIYKYHFVSVPLQQSENPASGLFLGSYLFEFTEGSNQWLGLGAPLNIGLSNDKGYLIYYPDNNITYSFAGKMNNDAFSVPVSYSGGSSPTSTNGWNLVPNPYPSAIDWKAASGWNKTNIDDAVYVWPSTAGAGATADNYASFVNGISLHEGSRYIAQGQSFFVHASASPAGFQVTNAARLHNPKTFFKDNEVLPDVFRLTSVAGNANDEMVVRFASAATTAFDGDWDAYKLVGGADAPQMSSLASDNSRLCINALPFNNNETVVPVNFSFSASTDVTFTASGMETFTTSNPVYLEDQLSGNIVSLSENPVYTFSYQTGSDENRFKLHFAAVTGMPQLTETTQGTAYVSGNKLYIEVPAMQGRNTTVGLYDALGRQLSSNQLLMNGMTTSPFPAVTGVVVVRVTTQDQVFVTKLIQL